MFQSILLSLGLQHKTVEEIEKDIELPANQILALFNRTIRKFVQVSYLHDSLSPYIFWLMPHCPHTFLLSRLQVLLVDP